VEAICRSRQTFSLNWAANAKSQFLLIFGRNCCGEIPGIRKIPSLTKTN
jgi:hypothetical protein